MGNDGYQDREKERAFEYPPGKDGKISHLIWLVMLIPLAATGAAMLNPPVHVGALLGLWGFCSVLPLGIVWKRRLDKFMFAPIVVSSEGVTGSAWEIPGYSRYRVRRMTVSWNDIVEVEPFSYPQIESLFAHGATGLRLTTITHVFIVFETVNNFDSFKKAVLEFTSQRSMDRA